MTAEGDVHMSDEALQGLGTMLAFLQTSLFGAITQLVKPPPSAAAMSTTSPVPMWEDRQSKPQLSSAEEGAVGDDPYIPIRPSRRKELDQLARHVQEEDSTVGIQERPQKLTDFVPDVGYFLAGGLSGITSRTATAPLDRLKVYLIAQTGPADAVEAVKSGKPLSAARSGARTLWCGCQDLWAAGGIRSLFAGA
jgi:solute carrier family 25 phosphate transporter 23/24/25/41